MKTLHTLNQGSLLRAPEGHGGGSASSDSEESHDYSEDLHRLYGETPPARPPTTLEAPESHDGSDAKALFSRELQWGDGAVDGDEATDDHDRSATRHFAGPKPAATGENPEDKIQLSDKAGADTKNHFQSLKGITKQLRAEIETLRKAPASPANTADLERLRAEHKSLSDRLSIVDLQSHPDFVAKYVEPKNKIVAGINEILTSNGIVGEDVSSLIGRPRAEFMKGAAAIADQLPDYERAAFMSDAWRLHGMDTDAKGQLSKASELSAALQRKAEESQRAAFDSTWKSHGMTAENLPPIEVSANASPEERASAEAYNKGIADMRTNAERIAFGKMTDSEVATSATKAAAFDFMQAHAIPKMEANFKEARELIASLTEEVKALKAARRGGDGIGNDDGDTGEDESHEAAASRAFRR